MADSGRRWCVDPDWYPEDVSKESYIYTINEDGLPSNALLMPTVGNGHLAGVVYRDRLFMNGLCSGVGKESHRAAIPALNRLKVTQISGAQSTYSLDCIKGIFTHKLSTADITVTHLYYAHRSIPSLLVNQITIERNSEAINSSAAISINVETGTQFVSADIKLEAGDGGQAMPEKLYAEAGAANDRVVEHFVGTITAKEVADTSVQVEKVYICMDKLGSSLTLPADVDKVEFAFTMSVNSSEEQCLYQYNKGQQLLKSNELLNLHYQAWVSLWQSGRIDIWCADFITTQVVYGCQYYLLSSLPSSYESDCQVTEFYGLSPDSLAYGDGSHDDYLGHVFWDQETWMYPPILLLHPEISTQLIQTRLRVIKQAKANAAHNNMKGVQFPWEQGVTGAPVSPSDDCGNYELHINADISLALRQYFYANGAVSDEMSAMATDLSDYWLSRLTWMQDKKMNGILDVMPPDEWHFPVNNSAFTNLAAKLAIDLPQELHHTYADSEPGADAVANECSIYVPFDEDLKYHPEFEGYNINDPKTSAVKQADVILIGYPLDLETDVSVRQNDLEMYEKVTTSNGPAMTWSMFCIGHLELNQFDKAAAMFKKQLLNTTQPFQVWSEYPSGGGAINFITGMGGFLQSLLNGYAGIRLKANGMTLDPHLPPQATRLKITGVSYKGAKFDMDITPGNMRMNVTKLSAQGDLEVEISDKAPSGSGPCSKLCGQGGSTALHAHLKQDVPLDINLADSGSRIVVMCNEQ